MKTEEVAAWIIVLFFGIGLHEYAHCKVADMCGDPTARMQGRVTLNLFKHFEPVGVIMMVVSAFTGIGLGWGRAAPINPLKMKNERWDVFISVAAGPISNFLQAVVYAIIFRILALTAPQVLPGFVGLLLVLGVYANLGLMIFNLIPFGPLDGHWLVGQLLPLEARLKWYRINRGIGFFGLIIAVTVCNQVAQNGGPDILGAIIEGPRVAIARYLMGI